MKWLKILSISFILNLMSIYVLAQTDMYGESIRKQADALYLAGEEKKAIKLYKKVGANKKTKNIVALNRLFEIYSIRPDGKFFCAYYQAIKGQYLSKLGMTEDDFYAKVGVDKTETLAVLKNPNLKKTLVTEQSFTMPNNQTVTPSSSTQVDLKTVMYNAQNGNADAQFYVACCYYNGDGIKQDFYKAYEFSMKAAQQDMMEAQTMVGLLYETGQGVAQNYEEARSWYLKAASKGDVAAQRNLGLIYMYGRGVDVDNKKAFEWLLKAASQGDVDSQVKVGYSFASGVGITASQTKAFEWYLKAAEQGSPDAANNVGNMYFYGSGVEIDKKKGFDWWLKAAEQGIANTQYAVGGCYLQGQGVPADTLKAFEWILKAAESQYSVAYPMVGMLYYQGWGVKQNYNKAFEWLNKAVENTTESHAYYYLAYSYAYGRGTSKNTTMALQMIDRAIELNAENLDYYDAKGEIYLLMGDNENASKIWDYINAKNPDLYASNSSEFSKRMKAITTSDIDINIPLTNSNSENTFAIVIAEEEYVNEESVPYALNDGAVFAEYCKKTLGLPERNIKFVQNATLNDIKFNINWINNVMKAYNGEAKVIFYYTGHGIPDEVKKTAYLLPVDGFASDVTTGLSLNELYENLSAVSAKSVTILLDACFSGTKREGDMLASARGVAIKVKEETPKGNVVVFSASQGDETAYPLKEQKHGMFTYYLLKKIQETKGDVTLESLKDYVTTQVSRQSVVVNGKSQTPTLFPSSALGDSWKKWK